jgi:predicted nucleic acid-binding protein
VIVVDSCGWLEAIKGAHLSREYAPALADPAQVVVPTICLLEVSRVMYRERGREAVAECLVIMSLGHVVPLDDDLVTAASVLGVDHRLPLADSVVYATARACDAEVWTHDPHFRDLPGVRFVERPKA